MLARRTIRLEPPYETNGSGIPVSGAIPSTAARLIAAWPQTRDVSPAARSFPKPVAAAERDTEPEEAERRERPDHEHRADEPEAPLR